MEPFPGFDVVLTRGGHLVFLSKTDAMDPDAEANLEFWEIFEQFRPRLYRFAYRMLRRPEDTEDIVQEAFLRMARSEAVGFDEDSARRWLFVVVRNLCLSRLRERTRRRETSLDDCDESQLPLLNPVNPTYQSELSRRIETAIGELPEHMREVIVLREYEEMNYQQIADVVDCSIGTVKSRIARGREELRQRLKALMEEIS